jgi:hypothetical protein
MCDGGVQGHTVHTTVQWSFYINHLKWEVQIRNCLYTSFCFSLEGEGGSVHGHHGFRTIYGKSHAGVFFG